MTRHNAFGVAVVAMSLLTGFTVAEGPGAAVGGVAGVALHTLAAGVLRVVQSAQAWLDADRKMRQELTDTLQAVREEVRVMAARLEGGRG